MVIAKAGACNSHQFAPPQHDAALHSAACNVCVCVCVCVLPTLKILRSALTSIKAFEVISGSGPFPAAADAGKTAEEKAAAATAAPAALTSPDRVKPVSLLPPSPAPPLLLL